MEDLFNSYLPGVLVSLGMATQDTAGAMCTSILNTEVVSGTTICSMLTDGFVAHYKGDEKADATTSALITSLLSTYSTYATKAAAETDSTAQAAYTQQAALYKTLYGVMYNLYNDSQTADRNVSFTF